MYKKVGNGHETFLWLDTWLHGGKLLHQCTNEPIRTKPWSVSDIVEGIAWILRDLELARVWNHITEPPVPRAHAQADTWF